MKKITPSLLILLLGFLGLVTHANAQSNAIPVPTYPNQSDMPAKMKPAQKMLRFLPLVVLNENGTNLSLFKTEMTTWIEKNPTMIPHFEKNIIDLISTKQFEKLAALLVDLGHSKVVSSVEYKGGKHE